MMLLRMVFGAAAGRRPAAATTAGVAAGAAAVTRRGSPAVYRVPAAAFAAAATAAAKAAAEAAAGVAATGGNAADRGGGYRRQVRPGARDPGALDDADARTALEGSFGRLSAASPERLNVAVDGATVKVEYRARGHRRRRVGGCRPPRRRRQGRDHQPTAALGAAGSLAAVPAAVSVRSGVTIDAGCRRPRRRRRARARIPATATPVATAASPGRAQSARRPPRCRLHRGAGQRAPRGVRSAAPPLGSSRRGPGCPRRSSGLRGCAGDRARRACLLLPRHDRRLLLPRQASARPWRQKAIKYRRSRELGDLGPAIARQELNSRPCRQPVRGAAAAASASCRPAVEGGGRCRRGRWLPSSAAR